MGALKPFHTESPTLAAAQSVKIPLPTLFRPVFGDLMFTPPALVLHTMASATHRIRLGVAAYSPWTQHPVEIAGQIAYLDQLSGGRAFYGIVRGA